MIRTRSIFRATVSCSCQYHNTIKLNMKRVKLSQTKDEMPTLGLGTWQAEPAIVRFTVYAALDLGYRHIDTAFNYNNEEAIGNAITKWIDDGKGTRNELFITTKLPHIANRASDVDKFVIHQLQRLQTSYIDLYLIHVPFGFHCDPETLTPKVNPDGNYALDMETDHKYSDLEEIGAVPKIRFHSQHWFI